MSFFRKNIVLLSRKYSVIVPKMNVTFPKINVNFLKSVFQVHSFAKMVVFRKTCFPGSFLNKFTDIREECGLDTGCGICMGGGSYLAPVLYGYVNYRYL